MTHEPRHGDGYLWDRSGPPDPDVLALEERLGVFRHAPAKRRWWPWAAAAAVLLVAATGLAVLGPGRGPGGPQDAAAQAWGVAWLAGSGAPWLPVGRWLETGFEERAVVSVPDGQGTVELEPLTRLRLVASGDEQHRLELRRGTLHALVVTPPRLFVIDTPGATAVDLGCAYTIQVGEDGAGLLVVTAGHVELEATGRPSSFVPMGTACRMHPGRGPGVPYRIEAPTALQDVDPSSEEGVLAALGVAREEDLLTLWHLIPRVDAPLRSAVYDRMASVGDLQGVDRAAVLRLDADALEQARPW